MATRASQERRQAYADKLEVKVPEELPEGSLLAESLPDWSKEELDELVVAVKFLLR